MPNFGERLQHAWNAFFSRDPTITTEDTYSYGSSIRPDRIRLTRGNERSIVNAIYSRIAVDVASVNIVHCRVDENDKFIEPIGSDLNNCLTLEANKDQTSRALLIDIVMSMFDEGVVAVVPIECDVDPIKSSFKIYSLRTGKITAWYPDHVRVSLYNDKTGRREEFTLPKKYVAIIENPFYSVMNEPNSTLQRLIRKLNLLDVVDEQTSSGKLDLIIKLPYLVKGEKREKQAEKRRKDIENQLTGTKYGIAYVDSTENITQLNRPLENNLMSQIEYLTKMLYGQLGMPEEIFNGTADEATLLSYYNRTIEPILSTVCLEFKRKWLTKTARTQGQSIQFFRDPFKLVPVSQIAEIADKFTRNEIMTKNEIRSVIGMRPSNDPKANELINSNINHPEEGQQPMDPDDEEAMYEEEIPPEEMEQVE